MDILNNTATKIVKKTRQSKPHYAVKSEEMLYKIANAGLLDKLHGVNTHNGVKTYYFSQCFEIKEIIDKFSKEDK